MADKSLEEMVKAVSASPAYKVLTKKDYDLLVSIKEGATAQNKDVDQTGKKVPSNKAGSPEKYKEQSTGINTSTSDNKHVHFDGTRPKFTFQAPGISPISICHRTLLLFPVLMFPNNPLLMGICTIFN